MKIELDKYFEAEKEFSRKYSDPRGNIAISKLVKSGNYITPEREDELIGYMKNNKDVTYTKLVNLFSVNLGFLQRLRVKYKFPIIKKDNVKSFQNLLALENKRRCPACKEVKHFDLWYPNNPGRCKECDRKNQQSKYERKVKTHLSSVDNFLKYKLANSLQRKNTINTLTHQDLINQYELQNGKCYYSGRPLVIAMRTKSLDSLSIDRVDSTKGYTPDNIVLCCSIINIMKLDTTKEQFIKLCKDITLHQSLLISREDSST